MMLRCIFSHQPAFSDHYRNAVRILFACFIFLIVISLSAEPQDFIFARSIRLEVPSVYRYVRLRGDAMIARERNDYSRERSVSIDAEYALNGKLALMTTMGRFLNENSRSEPRRRNERLNIGLKLADTYRAKDGFWAYGAILQGFNRRAERNVRARESANLYQIRMALLGAFASGPYEAIATLGFQTETSASFSEGPNEEFRRHYTFALTLSRSFGENWRAFLETEYREPYDPGTDVGIRFWRVYPGLRYRISKLNELSVSFLFAMRAEIDADSGLRLAYTRNF